MTEIEKSISLAIEVAFYDCPQSERLSRSCFDSMAKAALDACIKAVPDGGPSDDLLTFAADSSLGIIGRLKAMRRIWIPFFVKASKI
jgi:hypothetical protein